MSKEEQAAKQANYKYDINSIINVAIKTHESRCRMKEYENREPRNMKLSRQMRSEGET